MKKGLRKLIIIPVWILVWEIISRIVNNPIYFAGPVETVRELFVMIKEGRFWLSVGASLLRIYLGLAIAFVCAWISATAAWRFPLIDEILSPFIAFLRSVPVAAVVVVLLIWFGAPQLVLYVSFMVIYPNLYGSLLSGYKSTDPKLMEMARAFRVPLLRRFYGLYRPAYLPYLATAMPFCIGMGYKSGVAAEVIGLPIPSVGERIYSAKIYLNTAGVFAWIVVILLLNLPAEKLVSSLLRRAGVPRLRRGCRSTGTSGEQTGSKGDEGTETSSGSLCYRALKKSYDGRCILDIEEACFEKGKVYCIMGESGAGKTTLLKLITERSGRKKTAVCFQENRLIPKADVLTNLYFADSVEDPAGKLEGLLPKELYERPAGELSGGEQRRVALARAVLSDGELLLLDEPFSGLDEENRIRAASWIMKYRAGRTMIVVTHDREDVNLLNADCMLLSEGKLMAGPVQEQMARI